MKLFFALGLIFISLGTASFAQDSKAATAKTAPGIDFIVEVEGGQTLRMKAADLAKLPRKEIKSNDHDGAEATYSGVELREILASAGAKLGKDLKGATIAQYLVVEGADGYRAVYSLTDLDPDFTDKVVILADKCDGKALGEKNGPWQVVATNEKKHARWVRQVTALKVKMAK